MFGFAYNYTAEGGTLCFQLALDEDCTFQGKCQWTPEETKSIVFTGTYVHMTELSVKFTVNRVNGEPHDDVYFDMLAVDDMKFEAVGEYEDPIAPMNKDNRWNTLVIATTPRHKQGKMSVPLFRPLKGRIV